MARLTEEITKTLFREFSIPVPEGEAARSPRHAREIALRLGGPVVVKALVPAGKRGKAGAVRFAGAPEEVEREAAELLGSSLGEHRISRVLVERRVPTVLELFVAITYDPIARAPMLLLSAVGGVDVEELASGDSGRLLRHHLDADVPLSLAAARQLAEGLESVHSNLPLDGVAAAITALDRLFKEHDAVLAEINPLTISSDGEVIAVGAVMNCDDDGLFRQPRIKPHLQGALQGGWRPPTLLERRVLEADEQYPGVGAVRFIELDGDIGFGICGGGASLTTFDAIRKHGGRLANYCDISPGPGFDHKMNVLINTILSKPNLSGFIFGWNIISFARGLIGSAEAVVAAVRELGIDTRSFPIVARLTGVGEEHAHRALSALPGVHVLGRETSLDEAGRLIVELTRKG